MFREESDKVGSQGLGQYINSYCGFVEMVQENLRVEYGWCGIILFGGLGDVGFIRLVLQYWLCYQL